MVIDIQTGLAPRRNRLGSPPCTSTLELPRPLRLLRCTGLSLSESVGLPLAAYVLGAWLGGQNVGLLAGNGGDLGSPR